jgi:hypothetical protein
MPVIELVLQSPPGGTELVFGASEAPPELVDVALAAALPDPGFSAQLALVAGGVDLVFSEGPGTTELVFTRPEVAGVVLASLAAELPGPMLSAWVSPTVDMGIAVALPALQVAAAADYASNTERPLVASASEPMRRGIAAQSVVETRFQRARSAHVAEGVSWQRGQRLAATTEVRLERSHMAGRLPLRTRLSAALPQPGAANRVRWQEANRTLRSRAQAGFAKARSAHGAPLSVPWQNTDHSARPSVRSGWAGAAGKQATFTTSAGQGVQLCQQRESPFQAAMRPPAGRSVWVIPIPPRDPCYLPPPGGAVDLLFSAAWTNSTNLVFICERHQPIAAVVVPVKRAYIVINNVSLVRLDTGDELPAKGLSMSLDADSWTWGWNCTLPYSARAMVDPVDGVPTAVQATVNGTAFSLIVEGISSQREFGKNSVSVRGRGINAVLDSPYAPTLSFGNASGALTAQQLMAAALTDNGVGIGWDVDWQLVDWMVPAGAWSHQGSAMSAILRIAEAAGAYVQPHDSDQTLRILHRYPNAPWDWAGLTPDIELPASVAQREAIDWTDKAVYNRVYVSGSTAGGILGKITRAGTAGDLLATMVTDPLMTHATAVRQRGRTILSNTGRQALVALRLPVLAETGVIKPGALVRYVDGGTTRIGISRSTALDYTWPVLRQFIGVETHVS